MEDPVYVILYPQSNTNPSDRYRVADSGKWMDFVNGSKNSYPTAGEYKTYEEAFAIREALNGSA
jgi:hypothetical protein